MNDKLTPEQMIEWINDSSSKSFICDEEIKPLIIDFIRKHHEENKQYALCQGPMYVAYKLSEDNKVLREALEEINE